MEQPVGFDAQAVGDLVTRSCKTRPNSRCKLALGDDTNDRNKKVHSLLLANKTLPSGLSVQLAGCFISSLVTAAVDKSAHHIHHMERRFSERLTVVWLREGKLFVW